jgi:tRNA 2-thiocytidine biosynthesis protein TtcA
MRVPTTRLTSPHKLDEETEKLQTRLCRLVGQAIADYRLIEDGDKVMVCLSGGKDSYGLLDILLVLQRRAPVRFDLVAVNLDQKQPGFPSDVLPGYLTSMRVPFHIESRDTYSIVKRLIPEGRTTCSLCSRLRRGHLYRIAGELGATKIALGHHRDDIVETLFLNLFYTGKLKAIPPKLRSKDGRHLVIRPLAFVKEMDLARYAELRAFPIIPCDLCGSQEDLKRKRVKVWLQEWERESPGCSDSIAAALTNVAPSLLMDPRLFDFKTLDLPTADQSEGDAWLDEEPAARHRTAQSMERGLAVVAGTQGREGIEGLVPSDERGSS